MMRILEKTGLLIGMASLCFSLASPVGDAFAGVNGDIDFDNGHEATLSSELRAELVSAGLSPQDNCLRGHKEAGVETHDLLTILSRACDAVPAEDGPSAIVEVLAVRQEGQRLPPPPGSGLGLWIPHDGKLVRIGDMENGVISSLCTGEYRNQCHLTIKDGKFASIDLTEATIPSTATGTPYQNLAALFSSATKPSDRFFNKMTYLPGVCYGDHEEIIAAALFPYGTIDAIAGTDLKLAPIYIYGSLYGSRYAFGKSIEDAKKEYAEWVLGRSIIDDTLRTLQSSPDGSLYAGWSSKHIAEKFDEKEDIWLRETQKDSENILVARYIYQRHVPYEGSYGSRFPWATYVKTTNYFCYFKDVGFIFQHVVNK